METPTPDLFQDYMRLIVDGNDIDLNCLILQAFLHGLYTGIVGATLWTISSSPKRSTFLHIIIIVLYVLLTVIFAMYWAFGHYAFIEHGENYYSVFTALVDFGLWWSANYLVSGICGGISTILVDITIIWRCWVLWECQWRIVFIPMVCVVAATVMKVMQIFSAFRNPNDDVGGTAIPASIEFAIEIDWSLIYILLMLVTTLMCTLLIVYRIVRLAQRIFLFRNIISALIESSALYMLAHIVYFAMVVRNMDAANYTDLIAAYAKAISPTLLVLRVTARSDSSSGDEESTASRALSDISFTPMENSSDNPSELSSSGSRGTPTIESV
ncbi:uncharacterized protein ARMOST_20654 [Armillaria ostoyae]|uniref:Uncharacterized protein n=1 Tax=Armillaria ostoyae TaxID=47428 RepID=A0A284S7W1_ARMOS|nr:uncharacterized protein ARMOST_20654 [Armillaria ostoyae]